MLFILQNRGYYVKIDNNLEELVSTTGWTSSEPLTDGVHTFYIRAVSVNNKTSAYSISAFSIDSSFIDTDGDGWSDEEEQLYGTDPNISDNYPLDTDDDHSPDTVDTDDDNDGYSDDMEAAVRLYIDTPMELITNNDQNSDALSISSGDQNKLPFFDIAIAVVIILILLTISILFVKKKKS